MTAAFTSCDAYKYPSNANQSVAIL